MKNRSKLYLIAGVLFILDLVLTLSNQLSILRYIPLPFLFLNLISCCGTLLLGLYCLKLRNHSKSTLFFCGGFALLVLPMLFYSLDLTGIIFLLMCIAMIVLKLRPCKWTAIASGALTALYILLRLIEFFSYANFPYLLFCVSEIGSFGLLWLLTGGHHLIPALADAAEEQDMPIDAEAAKAAASDALRTVTAKVSASASGKNRHAKLMESTLRNLQQQRDSGFITQSEYEKLKKEIEAEG